MNDEEFYRGLARWAANIRDEHPSFEGTVIETVDALRKYITLFANFTVDGDDGPERIEIMPDEHIAMARTILKYLEEYEVDMELSGLIKRRK